MSDLIYKEYIKKQVQELNPCDYGSISSYEAHYAADDVLRDVLRIIDDADIAYDVDNVIEELEANIEEHEDECGFDDFSYIDSDTAIAIVKAGGVNE